MEQPKSHSHSVITDQTSDLSTGTAGDPQLHVLQLEDLEEPGVAAHVEEVRVLAPVQAAPAARCLGQGEAGQGLHQDHAGHLEGGGLVRTQQQSEAESVKSYLEARGLRAQPEGRGPRGRILLAQLSSAAGFIILGFQAAQQLRETSHPRKCNFWPY